MRLNACCAMLRGRRKSLSWMSLGRLNVLRQQIELLGVHLLASDGLLVSKPPTLQMMTRLPSIRAGEPFSF
jgi:hypothetical protein